MLCPLKQILFLSEKDIMLQDVLGLFRKAFSFDEN